MDDLMYILDRLITVGVSLQFGAVLGLSCLIIWYYSRHRNMLHIALVSASYIILTGLVAGAVVFRIFLDGPWRTAGIILAILAFAVGDISLWMVWKNRNEVTESQEMIELHAQLDEMVARLEKVEALEHVSLPDVVKVSIVNEDGESVTDK